MDKRSAITGNNPQNKLSAKIDKKALQFLKKVAKKNKKEERLVKVKRTDTQPVAAQSSKATVSSTKSEDEPFKVPEKTVQESTLCSVSAEISEGLVSTLTETKLIEIVQGCGVKYEKHGEKFVITGSWEIIQLTKNKLDETKTDMLAQEEADRAAEAIAIEKMVEDGGENLQAEEVSDEFGEDLNEEISNSITANIKAESSLNDEITEPTATSTTATIPDYKVSLSDIDPCETMITIAPNRGQVHRVINKCPNLATEVCDHCGYQSSKEGVVRHKQRRHPKVVYKCQVCDAAFGIRYDMRRHRMNHFTKEGKLTRKGIYLWNTLHPESNADLVHYQDFEENFHSEETHVKSETNNDKESPEKCIKQPVKRKRKKKSIKSGVNDNTGADNSITEENENDQETIVAKKEKTRYPPKDTSRMDCPICKKNYPLKVLAVHMRIHKKKEIMPCEYCGMEFTERGKLNVHVKAKHDRGYTCVLCGAVLSGSSALKSHIQGVHGDDVYCKLCKKKFSTPASLTLHIKREHVQEKNHHCGICGRGFFDKRTLKNHRVTHYDAATKESLKQHTCSFCGKKFLLKHILKMHENIHTGNKPYKCKICPKAFPYLSMLHKHLKVHSDIRNFKCPFCHKAFKFPYKLRHHMILHTKERKNACCVCGKFFTTPTTLKLHNCTGKMNLPQLLMERDGQMVEINIKTEEGKQLLHELNQTQHQLNPQKTMYMCGYCDKSFDDIIEINTHVLSHQDLAAGEDEDTMTLDSSKVVDSLSLNEADIVKKEEQFIINDGSDNKEVWELQNQETIIYEDSLIEEDQTDQNLFIHEDDSSTMQINQSNKQCHDNVTVKSTADGTEFVIHIKPEKEVNVKVQNS